MTDRGKHSRQTGTQFYKDVLLLIAGILIVGALVFGGLSLLAGNNDPSVTSLTTSSTTTPDATSTSSTSSTSSTTSTTTTSPTTTAPQSTTSSAPPTTERQARPVNEITVVVLNSIGVDGLAGELSTRFAEQGYVTLEAANYQPTLDTTTVFHAQGFALEAGLASQLVPDPAAVVAADPELAEAQGADVVVVIGQTYEG